MARKSQTDEDVEGGEDPVLDNDDSAKERQSEQERLRSRKAPAALIDDVDRQSDPIGIDCEGGVTTNEEGDSPGSDLETRERHNPPRSD